MPSLPQTKYCFLCPAKFTRTTHLNRHLRSREHSLDIFTKLLTDSVQIPTSGHIDATYAYSNFFLTFSCHNVTRSVMPNSRGATYSLDINAPAVIRACVIRWPKSSLIDINRNMNKSRRKSCQVRRESCHEISPLKPNAF